MGVLATFDSQATWEQTHVCDGLVLENLERLGAAWGRWNVQSPWPANGALSALLKSRRTELTQLHQRFCTESVARLRLLPGTPGWPDLRRTWQRLQARDEPVVHWVLEGTLVVYLQTDDGYLGVLCEAGEWLAIPAGVRYARDAGEAPDLDVLVLSASAENIGSHTRSDADTELPSLDEFVETMLELTGHAVDE